MSGVGIDPETIAERLAECFDPDDIGVNVFAFPPDAPQFPALGVFPGEPLIENYQRTLAGDDGEVNFILRTVVPGNTENALRVSYRLLSKGAARPESIVDALLRDRTLGGAVRDVFVEGGATAVTGGVENAPVQVLSIPVKIMCRKRS